MKSGHAVQSLYTLFSAWTTRPTQGLTVFGGVEPRGPGILPGQDHVLPAVINKRASRTGLISGRKAFQRPMADGVELLHAIQDVYLDPAITIA